VELTFCVFVLHVHVSGDQQDICIYSYVLDFTIVIVNKNVALWRDYAAAFHMHGDKVFGVCKVLTICTKQAIKG
jgi:hypothetical protein